MPLPRRFGSCGINLSEAQLQMDELKRRLISVNRWWQSGSSMYWYQIPIPVHILISRLWQAEHDSALMNSQTISQDTSNTFEYQGTGYSKLRVPLVSIGFLHPKMVFARLQLANGNGTKECPGHLLVQLDAFLSQLVALMHSIPHPCHQLKKRFRNRSLKSKYG